MYCLPSDLTHSKITIEDDIKDAISRMKEVEKVEKERAEARRSLLLEQRKRSRSKTREREEKLKVEKVAKQLELFQQMGRDSGRMTRSFPHPPL